MLYWITFHIIIVSLMIWYSHTTKSKKICKWLTLTTLIYFSGFRYGLGSDWYQYGNRLDSYNSLESLTLGVSEPLFNIIGLIITNSFLSPTFLFLICAIVTNVGIGRFLFENDKYVVPAVLIYVFLPTLYGMSFNIVRQFFAVGLFFYSLKYLGKSFWKFFTCIILAAMMHMSAIILLPLYWLLNINIPRKYVIPSLAVMLFCLAIIMRYVAGMEVKYAEDASSDNTMASSGMIVLYNLFFILLFLNIKIYEDLSIVHRNLFVLFILLSDASFINYSFYRLSYYFFPVVTYVFPYLLYRYSRSRRLYCVFIFLLILLNYYGLLSNINNEVVVPDRILPVLSIFDKYYHV